MVATRKQPATRPLTARNEAFARLVVSGTTHGAAWKEAYAHPKSKDKTASEAGSRLANDPRIVARMNQMRGESLAEALLSVNDRLRLLGAEARKDCKNAADRNARARLIEVYTKLAGGAQPDRVEHTGKDGEPIQAVVTASVTVHRAPVKDRIAALRAAKEARG